MGMAYAVPDNAMGAGYVRFIMFIHACTDEQGVQNDSMSMSIVRERF